MQAKSVVPHALFIALTLLLYSAVVQAAETECKLAASKLRTSNSHQSLSRSPAIKS